MNATMQIPTTGWNPGVVNPGGNGQNRVADMFGNPATGVFPYAVNTGYPTLLTGFPQGALGTVPFVCDPQQAINAFSGINYMNPNLLNLLSSFNQIPAFNPVSPIPLANSFINPLIGYAMPNINLLSGGFNPYFGLPVTNQPVTNPLTQITPAVVPHAAIPTFGGVPYNIPYGIPTPIMGTQFVNTVPTTTPLMNPALTQVGNLACTIPVQNTTPIWNHPGIPVGQQTIPLANLTNVPAISNLVGNPLLTGSVVVTDPYTGTRFLTQPAITATPTIIPFGGTIPNYFAQSYPINHPFWGVGGNWNVSAFAPGNWLGNSLNWRPNFPFQTNPYAIGNNPILTGLRGWNASLANPFAAIPNWSCTPPIGVNPGILGLSNLNPIALNPTGVAGCTVC